MSFQYSEQDQQTIIPYLDETTKENLNEVVEELSTKINFENVTDPIDTSVIKEYLDEHNINVIKRFESGLTNVFAVMKYIMLYQHGMSLSTKVEEDLAKLLNTTKVRWTVYKDLTNKVTFFTIRDENSDEKPQSLDISYRYDDENEELIYSIPSFSFSWDLTKNQLKALIEKTDLPKDTVITHKKLLKNNDQDIQLVYNGMKITISKE